MAPLVLRLALAELDVPEELSELVEQTAAVRFDEMLASVVFRYRGIRRRIPSLPEQAPRVEDVAECCARMALEEARAGSRALAPPMMASV